MNREKNLTADVADLRRYFWIREQDERASFAESFICENLRHLRLK